MAYIVVLIVGMAGGALCMFIALLAQRNELEKNRLLQSMQTEELNRTQLALTESQAHLGNEVTKLREAQVAFQQQLVTYEELTDENQVLKRDLRNFAISLRKAKLDHQTQQSEQERTTNRVQEVGKRYLKDSVKWIGSSLNSNNYIVCKQKLEETIEHLRSIGFHIPTDEEGSYLADLRVEYERIVRAALEREEQARIRAQIREEQKLERDIQHEKERIEREKRVIEAALERALAETKDQHSAEIESLRAKLAEAESRQRAISQAQLTKAGHIYVISNVGSFGENVYKIGMTRRLEPMERVRELGGASVPFPFDVHMMISCTNAPALENALHKALVSQQVNKMNPRKEFFRADIKEIVDIVKQNHGEVEYLADAEALQYRQSLTMSSEDLEFIEHLYEEGEEDSPDIDEGAEHEAAGSLKSNTQA